MGEDIIALWSNAGERQRLALTLAAGPTRFKQVTLTRFAAPRCSDVRCAAARDQLDIGRQDLAAPPATIAVEPRYEFYFLSVISDRPGFGWLAGERLLYLPLVIADWRQPTSTAIHPKGLGDPSGFADDPSPPASPVRLIFIHHSTGGNWLADPNDDQPYGGLGRALMDNNYYVSATNYGWGPDGIGDRTDIPNCQAGDARLPGHLVRRRL